MSANSAASIEPGQTISLKGSTDIVTQFFEYSVNSILYQRGIYPPETFKRATQYGLTMMVTTDEAVREYIQKIMHQLRSMKYIATYLGSIIEQLITHILLLYSLASKGRHPEAHISSQGR
jgi:HORMA domain